MAATQTFPAERWCENIEVFITPHVSATITYFTSEDVMVTTTVIFRDLFDIDDKTYLVLANGNLMPLQNLVAVHVNTRESTVQPFEHEDISGFHLVH